MQVLVFVAAIIFDVFLALLAITILALIWRGKIPFYRLLSEPTGDASLSRLQFLIFTYVVALSLLIVILGDGKAPPAFPPSIPVGIFALLGISASSYLISKGIQFSNPAGVTKPTLSLAPATIGPPAPGGNLATTVFTATIINTPAGTQLPAITWSLDAPSHGTILPQTNGAQYTPAAGIAAGTTVTIRAQAAGFEDGTAVVKY